MRRNSIPAILLAFVFAFGCASKGAHPVEVSDSDICSYCKMAISEKQYAAEFFDSEGEVYKFDEIGCMRNFVARAQIRPTAVFVKDFESRTWLDGKQAVYVRSEKFNTPMNGQITAFKDNRAAQAAAAKFDGTLVPLW